MFEPKCYNLINKRYDPKQDIRKNREKIREWLDTVEETHYKVVFDTIEKYIESIQFPMMDIPFYDETMEGWKLITRRNKLEREHPREFKQVLTEEKREIRETARMRKEDYR